MLELNAMQTDVLNERAEELIRLRQNLENDNASMAHRAAKNNVEIAALSEQIVALKDGR